MGAHQGVRGSDVNSGRVSVSALERAAGWLGVARVDPAEAGSEFERDEPSGEER